MMHPMMSGVEAAPFFWIILVLIPVLLLLGAILGFAMSQVSRQRAVLRERTPEFHMSFEDRPTYDQGYQAQQPIQEMYQEGERVTEPVPWPEERLYNRTEEIKSFHRW